MRFDMRHATPASYAAAIDMAEWAKTRGCFMIGLSEHHASPDGYLPSPLVLAAAMAARTRQVSIMVAAALLPFYDPIRLAEDMSVLDHVSGGRVSYVLGWVTGRRSSRSTGSRSAIGRGGPTRTSASSSTRSPEPRSRARRAMSASRPHR